MSCPESQEARVTITEWTRAPLRAAASRMRQRGTAWRSAAVLVVLAVASLAAVADGQVGCPSGPAFEACVGNATKLYNAAKELTLDPKSSCSKTRACEYLKDVYGCVQHKDCCNKTATVLKTLAAVEAQVRPLGVFQVCDAIDVCAPDAPEKQMPTGCCPMPAGESKRVCCRSADCSLCYKKAGQYVLANNTVPRDVHLVLEAIPVGTGWCPDGKMDGARQGVICNKQCSGGVVRASTNNDYVYHALVSASVHYTNSSCPDCCALSFDSPEDMPCSSGCNAPNAKCHVCRPPASAPVDALATPTTCTGFMDAQTCARYGDGATCRWHPCKFHLVTFSWYLHRSVKITARAPHGKMYSWAPSVSGWLILRYQIRFQKHRRTCCPFGEFGTLDQCCGGRALNGMFCADSDQCLTPTGQGKNSGKSE